MPIVAASVVPHSPLLLPRIAKEHQALFALTDQQIQRLAADWYAAKPDVVIVLSPHGREKDEPMSIHSAPKYKGTFVEFGDLATTVEIEGAVGIMHQLRSTAEQHHVPIHLQTYDDLDYGTSVPLSYVVQDQPNLPLCSVLLGSSSTDVLMRFAGVLRDFVLSQRQRFLLIASCDMTRRVDRQPDSRRRPTAEERTFSSAITGVDPSLVMGLKPQANTCGYGPLLVLLGVLNGIADHGTITSFEAPLGVGLLTATFDLNT